MDVVIRAKDEKRLIIEDAEGLFKPVEDAKILQKIK